MTILQRTLARLGYVPAATKAAPGYLPDEGARWSMPGYHLPEKQGELYTRLSWVHIAVSTVAKSAAGVTLNVRQRQGVKLKDLDNHPFEVLLQRPNPHMSRFELLQATFASYALTGNAYWWLNRRAPTAEPSEVYAIPSHRITPVPDGRLGIRGYVYDDGQGREIPLDPWEIVHFKTYNPLNAYIGLSPVEALATIATGDMAMAQWNTNHFGQDNAKLPGFLAFKDPVPDAEWERMKADLKRQYGGTKRSLMMLRNVGEGVAWVATAMSQKDMEFLAGRTFNREEIFATFAPGLASVLAVNATEANAIAGKRTFTELAVWPALVAVAEKLTNDVLPVYGTGLVAAFDEVRLSDRAMDLQEQDMFARTHTIREIRERYYEDAPLGDERDELLPVQVTPSAGGPEPEPEAPDDMAERMARLEAANAAPSEAPPAPNADEDAEVEVKAELARWERFAVKRMKEGKPDKATAFETDVVPWATRQYLAGALEAARDAEAVRLAFVQAHEWTAYP